MLAVRGEWDNKETKEREDCLGEEDCGALIIPSAE